MEVEILENNNNNVLDHSFLSKDSSEIRKEIFDLEIVYILKKFVILIHQKKICLHENRNQII